MKITDCFWELENIGKKTVQLDFDNNDVFVANEVHDAIAGYEYLVAKVPCGSISCLLGLQTMGFKMIETQMTMSKKLADFNFNDKGIKIFSRQLEFVTIREEEGLRNVLTSMTPNMFSTDRIYYDSEFGAKVGLHRYQNWIKSEFKKEAILFEFSINSKTVGFGLIRQDGECIHGLLGGLYEKYQNMGCGILTAACPFLYCHAANIGFKKVITNISSNNVPVMRCYTYLDFKIDYMSYILVKHQ